MEMTESTTYTWRSGDMTLRFVDDDTDHVYIKKEGHRGITINHTDVVHLEELLSKFIEKM